MVVDNRNEIRQFLASRRARITPEQAGLPAFGGNRHVSGLRREEVALLAGVILEIRPGQTIYTPPGQWHWHGAALDHVMSHLAIWEGPGEGQGRKPSGATS